MAPPSYKGPWTPLNGVYPMQVEHTDRCDPSCHCWLLKRLGTWDPGRAAREKATLPYDSFYWRRDR